MKSHLVAVQLGMTGRFGLDRRAVGSTAEQLRLRDSMLADLRAQNKALAGEQPAQKSCSLMYILWSDCSAPLPPVVLLASCTSSLDTEANHTANCKVGVTADHW